MKTLRLFILTLITLSFAVTSFAAWSDESCSITDGGQSAKGKRWLEVTYAGTSDAGASDYDFPSSVMSEIKDLYLYQMKIIPGTGDDAPSAAFDCDIEDEEDDHILDTDSNSETSNTFVKGHATLGVLPKIREQVSVVCATLGADNTVTIVFIFAE